jgi:hypothetical protein
MPDSVHVFLSNKRLDFQSMPKLDMACGLMLTNLKLVDIEQDYTNSDKPVCEECFKILQEYRHLVSSSSPLLLQVFLLTGDGVCSKR